MIYSNGLTQLRLFLFTKIRLRIMTSTERSLFFFAWLRRMSATHVLASTEQFWGWSYQKRRHSLFFSFWAMDGESSPLDKPVLFRALIQNVQRRNTLENRNLPWGQVSNRRWTLCLVSLPCVVLIKQLSIWSMFLAASVVEFQIKIPLFCFPSNDVPGWSCKVFVRTSQWSDATTTITIHMGPNKMKLSVKF